MPGRIRQGDNTVEYGAIGYPQNTEPRPAASKATPQRRTPQWQVAKALLGSGCKQPDCDRQKMASMGFLFFINLYAKTCKRFLSCRKRTNVIQFSQSAKEALQRLIFFTVAREFHDKSKLGKHGEPLSLTRAIFIDFREMLSVQVLWHGISFPIRTHQGCSLRYLQTGLPKCIEMP